jgi:uncharacterized membrane protein YhaH (DUF805 family)
MARQRLRDSLLVVLVLHALGYEPRFTGRARRAELCTTLAASLVAGFALGPLIMYADPRLAPLNALFLALLLGLPALAVMVRRLHDANRDAVSFLVLFVPYIGWAIFFGMLLGPGAEGDNQFGPDPRL